MKYRHCDGKLVLKVTDDQTVRTSLSIHSSPSSNPPPSPNSVSSTRHLMRRC